MSELEQQQNPQEPAEVQAAPPGEAPEAPPAEALAPAAEAPAPAIEAPAPAVEAVPAPAVEAPAAAAEAAAPAPAAETAGKPADKPAQKPAGPTERRERPAGRPERGERQRGPERGPERGLERGGERGGERRGPRGPERGRGPEISAEIEIEKLVGDSLYLDNQAHAIVARMRDMDSGTRSQLRRLYSAVRRACRAAEADRQHQFVMLRARLAYTIARHQLRSLDPLERLLLQVTRRNDARGYERFRDLFEAIVAYNE